MGMDRSLRRKLIDISTPLHPHTMVYPGDPVFTITTLAQIDEEGKGCNLSSLSMSAHTGTYIDAPYHFFPQGKYLHEFPSERWLTRSLVISTGDDAQVEPKHLVDAGIEKGMSILFRTKNCNALARGHHPEHPCTLSVEAAAVLVQKGVSLVGIDWLSIEGDGDPGYPVHRLLLANEILILEGIQLHHIEPGPYSLFVSPLHVMDADGAPARAFLME
jgi:arylformamidase